MAKMKGEDLIPIYNNIARRKKLPQIAPTTKIPLFEMADKLEWVNAQPDTGAKPPKIKRVKTAYQPGYYSKKYPSIRLITKITHRLQTAFK